MVFATVQLPNSYCFASCYVDSQRTCCWCLLHGVDCEGEGPESVIMGLTGVIEWGLFDLYRWMLGARIIGGLNHVRENRCR